MLDSMLLRKGFVVEEAEDGMEALRKAIQTDPDIILLDVTMPGMSGFEVYKKLKENPKTQNTPIIFCTSTHITEIIKRKEGADEYVEKPFDVNTLYGRIDKVLKCRGRIQK